MEMVERREFVGVVEGLTFCSERFPIRKHARSIPRTLSLPVLEAQGQGTLQSVAALVVQNADIQKAFARAVAELNPDQLGRN
jgi:hypothetical protein